MAHFLRVKFAINPGLVAGMPAARIDRIGLFSLAKPGL
jgi:hypothetical protein